MQSGPPAPPVGQSPWPQPPPPPPRKPAFPILVIALVIILVIGLLAAAFAISVLLPFRTPVAIVPSVTLGPVGFASGNATFNVSSVSTPAPIGFFLVNLGAGGATGTIQRIELNPNFATVAVSTQRYRIYFIDAGSNLTLSAGDRFVVTGNGTPLRTSTTFTFYLVWILDGSMVGSTNWTESTPIVTFSFLNQSSGNATIAVARASQAISPSNYKVTVQVGVDTSSPIVMPSVGGWFVSMTIRGAMYRVYWTDITGEGTLNAGDVFRITGDNTALPGATLFTFHLLWADASSIQSISWSTP